MSVVIKGGRVHAKWKHAPRHLEYTQRLALGDQADPRTLDLQFHKRSVQKWTERNLDRHMITQLAYVEFKLGRIPLDDATVFVEFHRWRFNLLRARRRHARIVLGA